MSSFHHSSVDHDQLRNWFC